MEEFIDNIPCFFKYPGFIGIHVSRDAFYQVPMKDLWEGLPPLRNSIAPNFLCTHLYDMNVLLQVHN